MPTAGAMARLLGGTARISPTDVQPTLFGEHARPARRPPAAVQLLRLLRRRHPQRLGHDRPVQVLAHDAPARARRVRDQRPPEVVGQRLPGRPDHPAELQRPAPHLSRTTSSCSRTTLFKKYQNVSPAKFHVDRGVTPSTGHLPGLHPVRPARATATRSTARAARTAAGTLPATRPPTGRRTPPTSRRSSSSNAGNSTATTTTPNLDVTPTTTAIERLLPDRPRRHQRQCLGEHLDHRRDTDTVTDADATPTPTSTSGFGPYTSSTTRGFTGRPSQLTAYAVSGRCGEYHTGRRRRRRRRPRRPANVAPRRPRSRRPPSRAS